MDISRLLKEAAKHTEPSQASRDRVRTMMRQKMRAEQMLRSASKELSPHAAVKQAVWNRVSASVRHPAKDVLTTLGEFLRPTQAQLRAVRDTVFARIAEPSRGWLQMPVFRLAASFAVFALLVRISPLLFLAQRSSAESSVILLPTRGDVELSLQDVWQPVTDEMEVLSALQLRTGDGEATVALHDDGNVRLDMNAQIILRDIADRPETATVSGPSVTLLNGRIWVQGLVPQQIRGIVVATPQGDVTVREGSVSIATENDGSLTVAAWDRHVVIEHEGRVATLISGEFVHLTDSAGFIVQDSTSAAARAEWVTQNLDRDAVHRHEIAELQQERRAADAGILPTSILYPVKRIAEQADLLMTFSGEEKVKKQLAFASTRLDEATALIAQGAETDSAAPLAEYREALLSVAAGSGADAITKQLVAAQMSETISDVAALTPTDSSYLVKRAVLEASAEIPDALIRKTDVEALILVDTLDALQSAAQSGNILQVNETFAELKPYLKSIKEGKSELSLSTRKEALALLEQFAFTVVERDEATGDVDESLLRDTAQYLPEETPVVVAMTDEQVDAAVAQMKARIYTYKLTRSRWNQLQNEFRSIEQSPDRGRILRALYHALPENGLAPYVRTEIQKARGDVPQ